MAQMRHKNISPLSLKKKKKVRPETPKTDLIIDPIFQVRSGPISGNQTRFLSGQVLGHSKLDLTRPNITPSFNKYL